MISPWEAVSGHLLIVSTLLGTTCSPSPSTLSRWKGLSSCILDWVCWDPARSRGSPPSLEEDPKDQALEREEPF